MKEQIKINKRFKKLLPKLDRIEYALLEENLLVNGCQDSILIWNNQIIDGHNRFEICEKHKLKFSVKELSFEDEDEACRWIINHQLNRRNLNINQKLLYIGKLYELRKRNVGAPIGNQNSVKFEANKQIEFENGENGIKMTKLIPNRHEPVAEIIAKEFGKSEKTVRRTEKLLIAFESVNQITKERFLDGKISIKDLMNIAQQEQIKEEPKPRFEIERTDAEDPNIQFMRSQSISIEIIVDELVAKIDKIRNRIPPQNNSPAPLKKFYEKIDLKIKEIKILIKYLMNLYLCEYCEKGGCDFCCGGYISYEEYVIQIKAVQKDPNLKGHLKKCKRIQTKIPTIFS